MVDIRLEGLRKEFDDGAVVAVRDLSLTFKEGTTTCLLGPSGCGKTTLMRMIAGLDSATTGRVFFGDDDVSNLRPRDRNLGMVFQYPVVYRGTTVRENLALPLAGEAMSKSEKATRVDEVLSLIGLEDAADTDVGALDGGTRQKVAVARAVSRQAPIVLFDEPITNVDIDSKLQLKRTLRELFTRLNQTIIYVTHDQTEAMTLADEIALMKDGEINQLAPPRELYTETSTVFGGWFLGNPGMNFVPVAEFPIVTQVLVGASLPEEAATVGFRPEDVAVEMTTSDDMMPASVTHTALVTGGQYLVSLQSAELALKAKLPYNIAKVPMDGDKVWWSVPRDRLRAFGSDETAIDLLP